MNVIEMRKLMKYYGKSRDIINVTVKCFKGRSVWVNIDNIEGTIA